MVWITRSSMHGKAYKTYQSSVICLNYGKVRIIMCFELKWGYCSLDASQRHLMPNKCDGSGISGNWSGTSVTRPQIVRWICRGWRTLHKNNALKFQIRGCEVIWHSTLIDALLHSRIHTTAQLHWEPNSTRWSCHSPPECNKASMDVECHIISHPLIWNFNALCLWRFR